VKLGYRPKPGRGGRGRRVGAFLAGAAALCGALLTGSLTVAASLVPGEWPKHHETLVWAVTGLLIVVAVVLAVLAVLSKGGGGSDGEASEHRGDSIHTGDIAAPVVIAQKGSTVHLGASAPAPAPAPQPTAPGTGQIVVGEMPGKPPAFVERGAVDRLAEIFEKGGRVGTVSALTGERGIGKTQVAAQYARQAIIDGVELVAWVSAESPGSLLGGLAEVAERLGVADPDGDSERSAKRLRDALTTRSALAVFVFDNAEDPKLLRPYLPATGPTRVVITSTDDAFASLGTKVPVGLFTRGQSAAYLAERTELNDEQGADAIAKELDDLPLALAQAASVIRLQGLTYPAYLEKLRSLPLDEMLPKDRGDPYPHGAARAILMSAQAVEDTDASGFTGRVLATVALLDAAGVDRELLAEILAPNTPPGEQLDATLARLVASSLLGWAKENRAVLMHRLPACAIRDRLQAAGELAAVIDATAAALTPLLPAEENAWEHRLDGVELVAQAIALWKNAVAAAEHKAMTPEELQHCSHLALWAVEHLYATADLSRAIEAGTTVLDASDQLLGPDHPNTSVSRNNLAYAYQLAGNLDKAIPLFERTLADSERVLGPDHPDTLLSRNNLASAYQDAGNLDKAIPLYESTLTDRERVLGTDHPDTLRSRNNLAHAYGQAGNLDKAIPLYTNTLTVCEQVLGDGHPITAAVRANLAAAVERQRRS
jgi:tetratricopeptide (TPR) repeat protein